MLSEGNKYQHINVSIAKHKFVSERCPPHYSVNCVKIGISGASVWSICTDLKKHASATWWLGAKQWTLH